MSTSSLCKRQAREIKEMRIKTREQNKKIPENYHGKQNGLLIKRVGFKIVKEPQTRFLKELAFLNITEYDPTATIVTFQSS